MVEEEEEEEGFRVLPPACWKRGRFLALPDSFADDDERTS